MVKKLCILGLFSFLLLSPITSFACNDQELQQCQTKLHESRCTPEDRSKAQINLGKLPDKYQLNNSLDLEDKSKNKSHNGRHGRSAMARQEILK